MRFIHYWRYLAVLSWLAVAAVGIWSFASLSGLGDTTPDGTPRTLIDKAFPYLFLFLVPLGLWKAREEFLDARDAIPVADAHAEELRQRRERRKKAQAELANRPPLADAIKDEALATVDMLKTSGVIGPDEIDTASLLELCQTYYLETGNIYELSNILAIYATTHGPFDNALFIADQVEVSTADITEMVEGFARLAGLSTDLSDIAVSFSNRSKRGSDGEVRFTLAGAPQTIAFEYHNKNASGTLMDGLAAVFTPTPPYATAYFDSVFLLTCLEDKERATLNAALDPDETFTLLVSKPPTR